VSGTIGEISASNMHDGRWMFVRRIDPEENNGNQCTIIGVRHYEAYDAVQVVQWLADRADGYSSLKRFEGGANWPNVYEDHFARGTRQSSPERAAPFHRRIVP
jgi:hypothetical protein